MGAGLTPFVTADIPIEPHIKLESIIQVWSDRSAFSTSISIDFDFLKEGSVISFSAHFGNETLGSFRAMMNVQAKEKGFETEFDRISVTVTRVAKSLRYLQDLIADRIFRQCRRGIEPIDTK
jgi:hypothetical protein